MVGIEAQPPELFDFDPTPLLFHARESGDQPLDDSPELRRKGWARLVLFASFLRPDVLAIPPISEVLENAFKPGLRNLKSHFGIFPFAWDKNWESSSKELIGNRRPIIQVAPVLERLVFPRARESLIQWLEETCKFKGMKWLVSAHYCAQVEFTPNQARNLKNNLFKRPWATDKGNWKFLDFLDKSLLKNGVVPKEPLSNFKD